LGVLRLLLSVFSENPETPRVFGVFCSLATISTCLRSHTEKSSGGLRFGLRELPAHLALNYRLPVTEIRDGWNEVLVINGGRKRDTEEGQRTHSVKIVSVELGVMQVDGAKK